MAFSTLLTGATLATMTGSGPYGRVVNGAVGIEDGKIAWAGPAAEAPRADARYVEVDDATLEALLDGVDIEHAIEARSRPKTH